MGIRIFRGCREGMEDTEAVLYCGTTNTALEMPIFDAPDEAERFLRWLREETNDSLAGMTVTDRAALVKQWHYATTAIKTRDGLEITPPTDCWLALPGAGEGVVNIVRRVSVQSVRHHDELGPLAQIRIHNADIFFPTVPCSLLYSTEENAKNGL